MTLLCRARKVGDRSARLVGKEAVERFLVPDELRVLHGVRILEARHAACLAADEAAVARPDAIVVERVASGGG